jgi:hypothetical protein
MAAVPVLVSVNTGEQAAVDDFDEELVEHAEHEPAGGASSTTCGR